MNGSPDVSPTTSKLTKPPMKKPYFFLALASIVFAFNVSRATTVIPPTFDELVSQAQVILQGSVIDVKSQWIGEGAERRIVSYVTFKVDDPIKGDPGANYTLRMLGGTVDGETMEVSDSPKFKVGDRDIIFVENNGSQFIPLVGIMHGRFHVQKDDATGREVVTTNERQPVRDVAKLGRDEHAPLTSSAKLAAAQTEPLSPNDFKARVRQALQNQPASR
jgi:hypothetical protein